jgi:phage recombination protein Bet
MQEKFGIDSTAWKSLVEAVFPNATTMNSVVLALSYCKARRLDPFKRCVHIVPIWNSEQRCMVDTIWPGIGELRTTAFRTGEYAGRGHTEFGVDITKEWDGKDGKTSVTFPEWAQVTVFRMIKGQRVEFCGPRVYWLETYANKSRADSSPNSMWSDRPRGQIDKCAEAAALRAAFPEEIGGEFIPEEVQHDRTVINAPSVNIGETRTESLMNKLAAEPEPEPEPEPTQVDAAATSDAELKAEWEAQQAKEAKEAGKLFSEPNEGHYADD